MDQHTKNWYLSHWGAANAQTSLRMHTVSSEPSHTHSVEVEEGSDKKMDRLSSWLHQYGRLK